MKKILELESYDSEWLPLLSKVTSDSAIIKFIIELDHTYRWLGSYLNFTELPGYALTHKIKELGDAHIKFKYRSFLLSFYDMPFFKIKVKLANEPFSVWNPLDESLKTFVTRNPQSEVVYFEDEIYEDTVFLFQERFSMLTNS